MSRVSLGFVSLEPNSDLSSNSLEQDQGYYFSLINSST